MFYRILKLIFSSFLASFILSNLCIITMLIMAYFGHSYAA